VFSYGPVLLFPALQEQFQSESLGARKSGAAGAVH
jgi:hypothetical protein